ncbi:MAG TPA: GrpB family protein [Trebonia sp.]|nr:GrpB family protein [Trebonia sp.]
MSDDTPPWAYEKPDVHPHDPRLIEQAETERARLAEILAPWLADGVEHVGSTSVPGLAAKPIIDLMASARDLDAVVDQAGERLWAAGWHYVPPRLDGRPWRRFFVKPDPSGQRRYAHLHLIEAGHPRWSEQIAFRDALRDDAGLAGRYGALKRRLAAEHPDDREAYTEAKGEFVAAALGHREATGAASQAEAD